MSRLTFAICSVLLVAACEKPSTSPAGTAPLAKWNGGAITAAELDQQMFEQRKQQLEQMLVKKLVEQKAKAEKLTPEELVKREISDKLKKPDEAEMKKFYDEQSKRQPLPPYEQIKDQIAQYMERSAAGPAQNAFIEKLKKEFNAEVLMKAPRLDVPTDGPAKGPAGAKVTIVEFSDFQCPFCSRAEETVNKLMKEYEGKIRVVFRDFPLPMHPEAAKAAEAAHCAGDQGKYWEMHAKLFANQGKLAVDALKGYAKELKLDEAKFDKCLDSGAKAKIVEDSKKLAEKLGVNSTPAFFVNGQLMAGAQPFEEFKKVIDAELAAKK